MPDETSSISDSTTHRLLAAMLTKDMQMSDGALLLSQLGVANSDIATVYSTTPASVRAAVSRGRRTKGGNNGAK